MEAFEKPPQKRRRIGKQLLCSLLRPRRIMRNPRSQLASLAHQLGNNASEKYSQDEQTEREYRGDRLRPGEPPPFEKIDDWIEQIRQHARDRQWPKHGR